MNERVRFTSCGCVVFELQGSLSDLSTLVTKQVPLFILRLNEQEVARRLRQSVSDVILGQLEQLEVLQNEISSVPLL